MSFTVSSIVMTLSVVPSFIALGLSLRAYLQTRYRYLLDISSAWLFLTIGNLFLDYAYFTLDLRVYRVGVLITIPFTYSLISLVDSVTRERLDAIKLGVITFINAGVFFSAFLTDAVRLNTTGLGETTPALTGWFMVFGSLTFLYAAIAWLYSMYRVYLTSPKQIKKYAFMNLLGSIIAGPGSAIAFISGLVWFAPGTDYLLIGIGALISTIAMTKEPKLGYVLTFRVSDLIVINTHANIPLFHYSWDESSLNSILFSGAIAAVSSVLEESIQKGEIREIKLQDGILIMNHKAKNPLAFVLVSSKSSKTLRDALDLFASLFKKLPEIQDLIKEAKNGSIQVTEMIDAEDIVQKAFPFIVSRQSPTLNSTRIQSINT